MTVYIDAPKWKKPCGRKSYCHLTADTINELHTFAAEHQVKPHFFHNTSSGPHYDVQEEHHARLVAAGAVEVSSREILRIAKGLL